MERYKLNTLYPYYTDFNDDLLDIMQQQPFTIMYMGKSFEDIQPTLRFIIATIYGQFFEDYVAYPNDSQGLAKSTFEQRLCYDLAVKLPYWTTKYNYIQKLFNDSELIILMQTSKMISNSSEDVNSVGGSMQKSASTPTGVSSTATGDEIDITLDKDDETLNTNVATDSFVDRYTNYQGKTNTASKTTGERSGTITRQGSIDELLKVLEKLPASFADEINEVVAKHFIFTY